jgi:hypothetical protein
MMMARLKIHSLICIFILTGTALFLESWQKYEGLEVLDILGEVEQNDIIKLHKYQPYICYNLKETEMSIFDFSSRYEDYYKSRKRLLGKMFNFFFYDQAKVNKIYYMSNFQLKNMFYNFRLLKEQEDDVTNAKDDSEISLSRKNDENEESSSLILSFENSKIKEEVKEFKIQSEDFNYYSLGRFFANLLLKDKFVCYSVHDLSLLIFRIFHYKYLNITYVYRFFKGFYDSLFEAVDDIRETKLRNILMERFLIHNLQVFLNVDQEMAQILVSMFDHKQTKNEVNQMILEFSSLYSFILKEVHYYRKTHNSDFKSYSTLFKSNPKLFVTNMLRSTSIFVVIFSFRLIKSLFLAPIAPFGELIVEVAMADASIELENTVRKILAPKHPEALRYLENKYFKASSELQTNSLEDFIKIFEEMTNSVKKVDQLDIVDLTAIYAQLSNATI